MPDPSLPAASALLSIVTAIAGFAAYLSQSRKLREDHARRVAEDWMAVAQAHEARVEQLTADLSVQKGQLEALAARMAEIEADREFLRQTNLDLQKKLSRAMQRIRGLESRLKSARVAVPDEEGS